MKVWVESRIIDEEEDLNHENVDYGDIEMVFTELSKDSNKRKLQCYIECEKCQEILTDKIILTREHL